MAFLTGVREYIKIYFSEAVVSTDDTSTKTIEPVSMQANEIIELSQSASDILRTLGHEHRFAILGLLCKQELCVGELEKLLSLTQPAVSQQLARLRNDGLVSARRQGRTIYYHVNRGKIDLFIDVIDRIVGKNDMSYGDQNISEPIAQIA
ncbi:ArsR/SmtB family transcription factor [Oryzibacter oryziterrae]|uniref:ArsR/SmtB family transcription factor n=1 Tax=Oryzibacter oryziterrae TaxID=2766474 RepID=UPI001F02840A|nr:metalloregulator ArsR/SmtB family transcription factor [Oryzibacter oryziterrae]